MAKRKRKKKPDLKRSRAARKGWATRRRNERKRRAEYRKRLRKQKRPRKRRELIRGVLFRYDEWQDFFARFDPGTPERAAMQKRVRQYHGLRWTAEVALMEDTSDDPDYSEWEPTVEGEFSFHADAQETFLDEYYARGREWMLENKLRASRKSKTTESPPFMIRSMEWTAKGKRK